MYVVLSSLSVVFFWLDLLAITDVNLCYSFFLTAIKQWVHIRDGCANFTVTIQNIYLYEFSLVECVVADVSEESV